MLPPGAGKPLAIRQEFFSKKPIRELHGGTSTGRRQTVKVIREPAVGQESLRAFRQRCKTYRFWDGTGDHELPLMGYSCPCPTTHVNTAAVYNSSAVSLFLLLVVVVTYVPASAAKRKRKAFSDGWKDTKGRPFLLTCAPLAAL